MDELFCMLRAGLVIKNHLERRRPRRHLSSTIADGDVGAPMRFEKS